MINPLRRQLLHVLGDDANDTRECYLRSLAETAMSRYKQLVRPKRKLSSYNGHVGQVLARVKLMNKVIELSMPVRQPVS